MYKKSERELVVITPEQVRLTFQTAGIASRACAQLVDWLLLGLVYTVLITVLAEFGFLTEKLKLHGAPPLLIALGALAVFAVQYGYFVLGEFYMGGRTIGKRVCGLRVMQENGQPLTFLSSAVRNLLRIVDLLPFFYFTGALIAFCQPQDKRLGDLLAGTVVVYDRPTARLSKRQRGRLDMLIISWKQRMPKLELTAFEKARINEEDWRLLREFVERLPHMAKHRQGPLSLRFTTYLSDKLGLSAQSIGDVQPIPFLLALYVLLHDDWELERMP